MFVLANFLFAVARILEILLSIAYWLILARALVSWVSPDPHNPIVRFLYGITEPLLDPIRRILPLRFKSGIDISALIAFFVILFLKFFLTTTLLDIAMRLK